MSDAIAIIPNKKTPQPRRSKKTAASQGSKKAPVVGSMQAATGLDRASLSDQPAARFNAVLSPDDKALHDWLRTIHNPTSPDGVSGVPVQLGTFELYTDLYQTSLSGECTADASGIAMIGSAVDSWIESSNANGVPDPACQTMGYTTPGYTALASNGTGAVLTMPAAGTAPAGITMFSFFVLGKPDASIGATSRMRTVAQRLTVWTDESSETAKGEVTICSSVNPFGEVQGGRINGCAYSDIIATNHKVLSRNTVPIPAMAKGGIRLQAVALPAEQQAFDAVLWPSAGYVQTPIVTLAAYAKGMAAGQKLQFRVDYVFEAESGKSNRALTAVTVAEPTRLGPERLLAASELSVPYSTGNSRNRPDGIHALPFVEELAQTKPLAVAAIERHPAMRPAHVAAASSPAPVALYRPASQPGGGFLSTIKSIGSSIVGSGILGAVPYIGPFVQGLASGFMKIFGS